LDLAKPELYGTRIVWLQFDYLTGLKVNCIGAFPVRKLELWRKVGVFP
jgi:hypothetical protein